MLNTKFKYILGLPPSLCICNGNANHVINHELSYPTDKRQNLEAHFKPLTDRKLHEIAAYLNLLPPPKDEEDTDKENENGKSAMENGKKTLFKTFN